MNHRPLNDLIDPEVVPESDLPLDHDSGAPNDAYVIGENGATVQAPDAADVSDLDAQKPRQWVKPAGVLLILAAIGLTFWNVALLMKGPPIQPPPTPFQAKQALYLGVMKVEAYRKVHGVTPEAMTNAGVTEGVGYAYRRLDPARYVLSFQVQGAPLEYDSGTPMAQFFGSPKEMLSLGVHGDDQ